MKRVAIATGLILVLAGIPAVSASHMSVGWLDTVGQQAEEAPDDPSVNETEYEIGTSTDCVDIDPEDRSTEEFQRAADADAFCGDLVYHEGTPYQHTSTPDQELNDPITEFDVVRSGQPWYGLGTCLPTWCTTLPGGEDTFKAFHDAGAAVGLTENGTNANEKDGDNFQDYAFGPTYPAAASLVQNQHQTWRMNGWYNNQPGFETFVGFLEAGDGEPVDEDRLVDLVADNRDSLPERSVEVGVCGFTPDSDISIGAAAAGWCEVNFEYVEESGNDTNFRDGYNEECKSPTYVCGAVQPAWHAILSCYATNPCSGYGSGGEAGNAGFDFTRWHWVVAPAKSDCNGQQEPGFTFHPGERDMPYLAHDLDVWTGATSLDGVSATQGAAEAYEWATYPVDNTEDTVDSLVENVTDEVPELPGAPSEVPDTTKDDRIEPNHNETDLATMGLSEDSQTKAWQRTAEDDPCTFFDDEHELDPWVNYVDMDTVYKGFNGLTGQQSSTAVYGNNDADHQDDVNQPTTGPVYFQGQVGVFVDKNDDGDYDQGANNNLWDDVQPVGAYPLMWDMYVDENGEINEEGGCEMGFGAKLPKSMKEANYGPHTGLVMAVYLEEPTVAVDQGAVTSVPYTEGQNIYIFESQAMTQLRQQDDAEVNGFIDSIVEGLQAHPDIPNTADRVYLNEDLELANSFSRQCTEASGGFDTSVSLVHNCEMDCSGDTIVTGYMIESTKSTTDGYQIGASEGNIPTLDLPGGEVFTLDAPIETWLDVDPFDNNPDRNREDSSAPPTGDE